MNDEQDEAVSEQQQVWDDESLEREGIGFISAEPDVAAVQFGASEALVRAAFALRGRRRLHADEMQAALDEVSEREV